MTKQSMTAETILLTQRLESWLVVNDPKHYEGPHGLLTPEVLEARAALQEGAEPAPAQARLSGAGSADALEADNDAQAMLDQYGAASPEFLDAWKKDPAGGAVTLSEMARRAAGYNPANLDDFGASAPQFLDYLNRIQQAPLFDIKKTTSTQIKKESSDWDTLIDAVAGTFQGIEGDDKLKIIAGLKNLASAASTKMSETQTQNIFVQSALNVDGDVTLYIYNSQISFKREVGKGYDTKQSEFNVVELELAFKVDLWPNYVAQVAKVFTANLDDWLNNNNTDTEGAGAIPAISQPEGGTPVNP